MVNFCVNILREYPKPPATSKPWNPARVFQTISPSWQWREKGTNPRARPEQHHVLPHPEKSDGKVTSRLLKCLSDEVVFIRPAILRPIRYRRAMENAHHRQHLSWC